VGGVVGAVVSHDGHKAASTSPPAVSTSSVPTTATVAPQALRVSYVSPTPGTAGVSPNAPITVTLSATPAKSSPLPTLSPATPGSWQMNATALTFTPSIPYTPLSQITVNVPGGASGVVAADGGHLDQSVVDRFSVADGTALRVQQLLSLLDYSPLAWTPTGAAIASNDTTAQTAALYSPPPGKFTWRNQGWPAQLQALWRQGGWDVFTQGLIMSFQADHGITPNGQVTAALWTALLSALAAGTVNTGGYNYAFADKAEPETLTIYHDGHVALRTPANTGIATSPTPDGTFPVYTRLRSQVMRGSNPDGTTYADLVQYIAYFHGNDAVHYMPRADYGIPQSLGCIELPFADAARAWPYLAYGTLVTVVN
jgi:peptidoglycan hydrolase-like protein with peptidoglycan-binding domain